MENTNILMVPIKDLTGDQIENSFQNLIDDITNDPYKAVSYAGTELSYVGYWLEIAKIGGKFTGNTTTGLGAILNLIDMKYVYDNDDFSTEEKTGRIAVDVGMFTLNAGVLTYSILAGAGVVSAAALPVVVTGMFVLGVATMCLDSESYTVIGNTLIDVDNAILTTPDRWQSDLNAEIAEETADLQVFTAEEITAMLDSQGFNGAEIWGNIMNKGLSVNKCAA